MTRRTRFVWIRWPRSSVGGGGEGNRGTRTEGRGRRARGAATLEAASCRRTGFVVCTTSLCTSFHQVHEQPSRSIDTFYSCIHLHVKTFLHTSLAHKLWINTRFNWYKCIKNAFSVSYSNPSALKMYTD